MYGYQNLILPNELVESSLNSFLAKDIEKMIAPKKPKDYLKSKKFVKDFGLEDKRSGRLTNNTGQLTNRREIEVTGTIDVDGKKKSIAGTLEFDVPIQDALSPRPVESIKGVSPRSTPHPAQSIKTQTPISTPNGKWPLSYMVVGTIEYGKLRHIDIELTTKGITSVPRQIEAEILKVYGHLPFAHCMVKAQDGRYTIQVKLLPWSRDYGKDISARASLDFPSPTTSTLSEVQNQIEELKKRLQQVEQDKEQYSPRSHYDRKSSNQYSTSSRQYDEEGRHPPSDSTASSSYVLSRYFDSMRMRPEDQQYQQPRAPPSIRIHPATPSVRTPSIAPSRKAPSKAPSMRSRSERSVEFQIIH